MWQQGGRYLLKQVDALQHGNEVNEQMQYLASKCDPYMPCTAAADNFLDVVVQLEIDRSRALRLVLKTHQVIRSSTKMSAEAWNEHMMLIISASRAHIKYTVLKCFTEYLATLPTTISEPLRLVLDRMRSLFALSNIINPRSADALPFLETTSDKAPYLTSLHLDHIRALVNTLLEQLLANIIALTDAWGFTDASLCSALGMYDGNVHGNTMRWVEQMPTNKDAAHTGWNSFVDPILKGEVALKARL
jgi:acyl-CoA oxidase